MRLYNMLFVCMGNICRSPAGEAVMRHLVEAEGLANRIHCDSAGTIAFHTGNPPDHRMHAAAANRNINTGGQARQICNDDYHSFDLILTMDDGRQDLIFSALTVTLDSHARGLYLPVPDCFKKGMINVSSVCFSRSGQPSRRHGA